MIRVRGERAEADAGRRVTEHDRRVAVAALERAHEDGTLTTERMSELAALARSAQVRGDLARVLADASAPPAASHVQDGQVTE